MPTYPMPKNEPLSTAPQTTGAGTALIKPPSAEPTADEIRLNPEIAQQYMGTQIAPGTQESLFPSIGGTPLYSETFDPLTAARQTAMNELDPETIEWMQTATPEEIDRFAYNFARALSKPRIEDAGDELTFTKIWKQQNGDPNAIDPKKDGLAEHKASMSDDWEEIFPGKPVGGFLTEKERKIWADTRSQRLVDRQNAALANKQQQMEAMQFGVEQFRQKNAEQRARQELEIERDKAQRERQVQERNVKPYVTPDGDIKYLPGNEIPPLGWKPYKDTTDTAKLNYIERVKQNFIKNFGPPKDIYGRVQAESEGNKLKRFRGWLKARNLEETKGNLNANDLDSIEEAIMTELGIPENIRNSFLAARANGATYEDILELIQRVIDEIIGEGNK